MRFVFPLLALLPLPALADTFVVPSKATDAIIYPSGGMLTHAVSLTLPVGNHQLVFPDLPPDIQLEVLRINADDLRLGAIRYREDFVPSQPDRDSSAIIKAKEKIKTIEAEMQSVRDAAARLALTKEAAADQIAFLKSLGTNEKLPVDPLELRQIAQMIGEEALKARQGALDAEISSRETRKALEDLNKDLLKAKADLAALVPQVQDRPYLVVDVSVSEPLSDSSFDISYFSYEVFWEPNYDIRLTDEDTPKLTVTRSADIAQNTGENWETVNLTLSTQQPTEQSDPSRIWPDLRRLIDPKMQQRLRSTMASDSAAGFAEPTVEAPVIVEEATISQTGLSLTYAFPNPVTIASGADAVRVAFDELTFPATLIARAVPMRDETAFIVARFTNDSGEPLLATYDAVKFFDGGLVGITDFPETAAGEEVELGFGPIKGLQLTRTVLDRFEGDRGIISRSNETTEDIQIELENLTDRTWDVELIDRVPFSEQEDLDITYKTTPQPDVTDLEDQRGILQWNIEMVPGNTATVTTTFKMSWPEGQIVQ